MTRRRLWATVAAMVAAVGVACGTDSPSSRREAGAEETTSTTTSPSTTSSSSTSSTTPSTTATSTTVRPPEDAALVAYAFGEDVWLYDRRSAKVRRLTPDGYDRTDHSPRFRDSGRLTFVSMSADKTDSTLVEFDVATGARRTVAQLNGTLWSYDWSADGSTFAYVASIDEHRETAEFAHEIRLVSAAGTTTVLRRFDGLFGRDATVGSDEVHVEWSPDGTSVLVVDTHLDGVQPETLFVIRPDSADVTAARTGIWARWSPDSRTVVFSDGRGAVRSWDTATGATTTLPSAGQAHRLAVSPDGAFLAYDDGTADPTVYLYDLQRRTRRVLQRHAVGPVWLSTTTVAAGHAIPCRPKPAQGCSSLAPPWTEAGESWRIDVATGKATRLPIDSTMDAATAAPR